MHASAVLIAAVASVGVLATPSYPVLTFNNAMPGILDTASDYFNMLAARIQEARETNVQPTCNVSNVVFPTNYVTPELPPPSAGLTVKLVALGRGTQNYTCDVHNATAAPVFVGAQASLFNATCLAAAYPSVVDLLPRVALAFNLTDNNITAFGTRLYPTNLQLVGHHFFLNTTPSATPFFDLDTPTATNGHIPCAKNSTQAAPADTLVGSDADNRGQQGETAVAWLKLVAKANTTVGVTGGLQEVYRMQTVGGSAPATCEGMPAAFDVQYAAQYWFYERSSS